MLRKPRLCFPLALAIALWPSLALAWGNNANRLVINRAIDTLPQDIRPFFDANRSILLQHVNDPLVRGMFPYNDPPYQLPFDKVADHRSSLL